MKKIVQLLPRGGFSKSDWILSNKLMNIGLCETDFFKRFSEEKKARSIYHNAKAKEYRIRNPDKVRQLNRIMYRKNAEKNRDYARRYRSSIKSNPEKLSAHNAYRNKYRAMKRATDPNYKLGCVIRTRIKEAIRKQYGSKSKKTMALLGCSVEECRIHIEAKWLPGMDWKNHGIGRGKWHIDHVKPCKSFDMTNPEHQKVCFHYTNLQPLWSEDNLRKGDSIDYGVMQRVK